MAFSVAQKTLERLDWSEILERLAGHARTSRGAEALGRGADASFFAAGRAAVRERLAETREARAILESGEHPPFGGVADVAETLGRAVRSGVLGGEELVLVAATLVALRETGRFLARHAEQAPRLAELASGLPEEREVEDAIASSLDASGEVLDTASPELARARRELRELAERLKERLERTLRDPDLRACLSDVYFTVRNERTVLPVRSDARGKVRGIVHDASASGTTLFIEPEALVELNNRHRRTALEIEREIRRVLRELSTAVAAAAPALRAGLGTLTHLDLAFARAAFAIELDATEPEVGEEGILRLPQLRHPGLPPDTAVPNDLHLGESFRVLVVSGPNAGGKTVIMKAAALAVLFVRAGLQVPAAAGARVDLFDTVLADIGDEQSIGRSLSTFSAHMANVAGIVEAASRHSFVALDEIGVGTDPGEGAALAQAILETLADAGARVVATTHFGLLKEMADVDPRFANASVEFDPANLAPTYRLRMDLPGSSSATAVAARMGLRREVIERAEAFLRREDRQLDRMLHELASARAALEGEQREAARLRRESDAARREYGEKLEQLQARRDRLYRAMRDDLDRAFRNAHSEIAAVIRDLQRGGSARDAARARERLVALAERSREAEREAGVAPDPSEDLEPVDWSRARPGDAVRIAGGGVAVLQSLPDARGRVAVRLGSARALVPAERVGRAHAEPPVARSRAPQPFVASTAMPGGTARCDLRGRRVAEALEELASALDAATCSGLDRLLVIHGIGTGALRRAVQEHLRASPYVAAVEPAGEDEGREGATLALLQAP